MGKINEMIVVYSDSESSNDSLELIDPVLNLSLEHVDPNKSSKDIDDQSNKLEKLHLNDSNEKVLKRVKTINQSRHHPYLQPNKTKINTQIFKPNDTQMKFLKSIGYIEYSSSSSKRESNKIDKCKDIDTIRSLFLQINNSIKTTFSKYLKSIDQTNKSQYICNKRFR